MGERREHQELAPQVGWDQIEQLFGDTKPWNVTVPYHSQYRKLWQEGALSPGADQITVGSYMEDTRDCGNYQQVLTAEILGDQASAALRAFKGYENAPKAVISLQLQAASAEVHYVGFQLEFDAEGRLQNAQWLASIGIEGPFAAEAAQFLTDCGVEVNTDSEGKIQVAPARDFAEAIKKKFTEIHS